MQKVTFINAKEESIELFTRPFFLNKIEGLGDVDADIQTQKSPNQDGSSFIDVVMEERYLNLEVVIVENLLNNRKLISRVFNPRLGPGKLIYENNSNRVETMAIAEHVPRFPDERPRVGQKALINLRCPDPFWNSILMKQQLMVWEGGLEFPLQLPTEFAVQSGSKAKVIFNDGDVETPIQVVFSGPATAPIRLTNITTGQFIEVNQDLLNGERLEMDTTFGKKRVTKIHADGTKSNVFHYLNLESSFFNLVAGNNLLDYSIGADYERASVSIAWNNRYLGI